MGVGRDWKDVPNHDGTPREAGDRFFGAIDPRLGRVRSASTTLGRRRVKLDLFGRGGLAVCIALLGFVVANGRGKQWGDAPWWAWPMMVGVAASVFWLTGPNPRCSYVGDGGAMLFERRLRLFARARKVIFDQVWDVSVAYTRVFAPAYRGTNARFTWVDDEDRTVVRLDGSFHEHRIDREEIDLAAIDRLPPSNEVVALLAAMRAFDDFCAAEEAEDAAEDAERASV